MQTWKHVLIAFVLNNILSNCWIYVFFSLHGYQSCCTGNINKVREYCMIMCHEMLNSRAHTHLTATMLLLCFVMIFIWLAFTFWKHSHKKRAYITVNSNQLTSIFNRKVCLRSRSNNKQNIPYIIIFSSVFFFNFCSQYIESLSHLSIHPSIFLWHLSSHNYVSLFRNFRVFCFICYFHLKSINENRRALNTFASSHTQP